MKFRRIEIKMAKIPLIGRFIEIVFKNTFPNLIPHCVITPNSKARKIVGAMRKLGFGGSLAV